MNPFAEATRQGYGPFEIIEYLLRFPKMKKKIESALKQGYTLDQITSFLQSGTDGKVRSPERYPVRDPITNQPEGRESYAGRSARNERKRNALEQLIDPRRALAAGGGAALGYATGGPLGAVAGLQGGNQAFEDIIKKYEDATAQGSNLSLQDFLSSAAKGTQEGLKSYAMMRAAKSLYDRLYGGGRGGVTLETGPFEEGQEAPQQQQVPQIGYNQPGVVGEAPPSPPEGPVAPEPIVPTPPSPTPVEQPPLSPSSYNYFKDKKVDGVIRSLAKQVEPEKIEKALTKLYGKEFIKDIKKGTGKSAVEAITEAVEYDRSQQEQQQPIEPVQEVVETKVEEEATIPEEAQMKEPQLSKAKEVEDVYERVSQSLPNIREKKTKPISAEQVAANKSSNVRYMQYDPRSSQLEVLFFPSGSSSKGSVYVYDSVPEDVFRKVVAGDAKTITTGENLIRAWPVGKEGSMGAAFDKFIKKPTTSSGELSYQPKQLEDKEITNDYMKKVREADQTIKASLAFEPFKRIVETAKAKQRMPNIRKAYEFLKELDDDMIASISAEVDLRLSRQGGRKTPKRKESAFRQVKEEMVGDEVTQSFEEGA